jgi:hypothetical protein
VFFVFVVSSEEIVWEWWRCQSLLHCYVRLPRGEASFACRNEEAVLSSWWMDEASEDGWVGLCMECALVASIRSNNATFGMWAFYFVSIRWQIIREWGISLRGKTLAIFNNEAASRATNSSFSAIILYHQAYQPTLISFWDSRACRYYYLLFATGCFSSDISLSSFCVIFGHRWPKMTRWPKRVDPLRLFPY